MYREVFTLKKHFNFISRVDNSSRLMLVSASVLKKVFGRLYDLPSDVKTRSFSYYNANWQVLRMDPDYVNYRD